MTLQENVAKLVRYCAQYQSHGFMMDERNTDDGFNVELREEEQIRARIGNLRVILLTGEAGDGKSRIMRNVEQLLQEYHFSEPCMDFSALTEEEKRELIERLRGVLEGTCGDDKLMISANVGVFTQAVIRYDFSLMEKLTQEREDVYICNFENRNLSEDGQVFERIVRSFLTERGDTAECLSCTDTTCPCYGACYYRTNIEKLLSEPGLAAVRSICNAIYYIGGHVTFRELLSLLSYMVTFGQNCQERKKYLEQGGMGEKLLYYNVFEANADALLHKVSRMDPALKRGAYPEEVSTKEEYISYRRQQFFEEGVDQYAMLNVDYLVEFHQVLQYMNRPPYHYDTVKDKNPILQQLKRGINKLSSGGRSDAGLVITDTPFILGNRIRTEFLGLQDSDMIWHRYEMPMVRDKLEAPRLWNKFYLSFRVKTGEKKLISLLIDYRQFCYLMLCSEDYFMNKNESTVEEYAVNAFYRKILQETREAYDSIIIRFDEKTENMCDFSLTVHESEDFWTGETERTVLIKRVD